MQHNYARKQYPSIQQPPNSNNAHWSNSTGRKIRYHEAPTYAQEPPAPYTSNNNFGGGGGGIDNGKRIEITREIFKVQRRFDLVKWFKRHPKTVMCFSYFCVLIIGITLGFVPYITMYMNACQSDRKLLTDFQGLIERYNDTNIVTNTGASSGGMPLTAPVYGMLPHRASARGNQEIELTCQGAIHISDITYNGVRGTTDDVKNLNKYCAKQIIQSRDTKRCVVSLQLVYKRGMYGEDTVTDIYYRCVKP
ncbi:uncharacterized protein [Clytia hemisphaerica]|uniref:Uncharacterized protein n=1 Tax=Clytia hemisphaerica TaxID=252671 RepID=A0A7M5V6I4_9CNID|eukprot:TCONS_00065608-protein